MDKIEKFLKRLSHLERVNLETVISSLRSGDWQNLDIKKLKGAGGLFRARSGKMRVIYRLDKNGKVVIIEVGRRNDTTYNL